MQNKLNFWSPTCPVLMFEIGDQKFHMGFEIRNMEPIPVFYTRYKKSKTRIAKLFSMIHNFGGPEEGRWVTN